MKRRDFCVRTANVAGLLLFDQVYGARPCPPALHGASGVQSCGADDLEADWQARISGPGVVWYHDFRNKAEVDNFRWTGAYGNDPKDSSPDSIDRGTVNWVQGDGITGGACLETLRRASNNDGGNWWRPFSPMTGSGNGRGLDDPGASGKISPKPWTPTPGGGETRTWDRGWYGNPAFHDQRFDGWDYYLQCRVKLHPNRPEEPTGGKLFYFTCTAKSLTSQEIVTKSLHNGSVVGDAAFFVYRSGGVPLASDPPGGAQPNNQLQPGQTNEKGYWSWPFDQWVTVLYHIKAGLDEKQDTLFEVWVDWDGSKKIGSYIKIWEQPTVDMGYDDDKAYGHNAIIASGYMNGQTFSQDIWQRYDQVIFSHDFIPCPNL